MSLTLTFILLMLGTLHGSNAQCSNPSVTTASGTHAPTGQICSGDLIFEDTFDTLNLKKWQHENTLWGGGNWEFQWYTNSRRNSYIQNGVLYLKPTLTADETGDGFLYSGTLDINGGSPAEECTNPQIWGCLRTGTADNIINPIKSAKVRTTLSLSFKYGKVEVNAKLPAGDWLWPAIWMMPRDNQYSGWPSSGEIDIMESRGNRDLIAWGGNIGPQLVGSTLHWGPNSNLNQYMRTHWEQRNEAGYDSAFHRYQLEWTPDGLTFLVDDQAIGSIYPPEGGFWELGELNTSGQPNPWISGTKMAPFDQEFYLMLNLAVGGTAYFPDESTNPGGKPWANDSPRAAADFWEGKDQWLPTWQLETENAALQIDYVRIWAL